MNFYIRSTLAALSDNFQENNNETVLDDWYNNKLGRVMANRFSQEFMDDAKINAMSKNFEQIRILSEGYHICKNSKGTEIKFLSSRILFSVLLPFESMYIAPRRDYCTLQFMFF